VGEGLHFVNVFLEAGLGCGRFEVLDHPFIILEFFLLQLPLYLFGVEELKGVWNELEALVRFVDQGEWLVSRLLLGVDA
jgi:hypothetical protein